MAAPTQNALDLDAWSGTDLGDPRSWPASLRTAAQLCLAYPTPCSLLWGERSRYFYNASVAATIGMRHPSGLGQPLYDVLPDLWRTAGPLVHEVMRTGRAFTGRHFPIQTDTGSGVSQFFVDVALVPVLDDGRVVGVFAPANDTTVEHLVGQHHAALAAVASVPHGLPRTEVAAQVARHLAVPDDVRFAVVFLRDPATGVLARAATGGAPLRPASTLAALDVAVSRGLWPLERVLVDRSGPERMDGAPHGSRVTRPLWEDAWLVALPEPADGVLVLGLNSRLRLPGGPTELVAWFARAAGERLGR